MVEAKGYLPVPDKPCAPMAMKMSMHRNDALCIVANAAASKACDSTTPEFPFYRYGGGAVPGFGCGMVLAFYQPITFGAVYVAQPLYVSPMSSL